MKVPTKNLEVSKRQEQNNIVKTLKLKYRKTKYTLETNQPEMSGNVAHCLPLSDHGFIEIVLINDI